MYSVSHFRGVLRLLSIGLLLGFGPSVACADAVYSAALSLWENIESPTPQARMSQNGAGTAYWEEVASAQQGSLRLDVTGHSIPSNPGPGITTFSSRWSAGFQYDDFVITGPGSSVAASMNLRLASTLTTSAPSGTNRASTDVRGELGGTAFGGHVEQVFPDPPESSGFLEGQELEVTTPPAVLPVGIRFRVALSLFAETQLSAPHVQGSPPLGSSAFGQTLGFSTSRPLFNLPDGYTAQSAEAGVVDNHFVPEPGAFAFSAFAAAKFMCRRRARRTRTSVCMPH